MKKRIPLFVTAVTGMLLLTACGEGPNFDSNTTVTSFDGATYALRDYLEIKDLSRSITVGTSIDLEVATLPVQYKDIGVTYSSENEAVATVNEKGIVTGVSKGVTFINVKTDDENYEPTKVKIYVGDEVDSEEAQTISDNIASLYQTGHTYPRKYYKREYSIESYIKDGVEQYGSKAFETMAYDADEGYLMIQDEYLQKRTAGGEYEKSSGSWIFYTLQFGYTTRFIHITETTKKFMDINTAAYSTNEEIILDILDMFFTSGRTFVSDDLDDYNGAKDYKNYLSDTTEEGISYMSSADDSLSFNYSGHYAESSSQVISVEDEIKYVDIPAGTRYAVDITTTGIFEKDRQTAYSFIQDFIYNLDGANWTRSFSRSTIFENEFEMKKVSKPEDNGFEKADSIYDL